MNSIDKINVLLTKAGLSGADLERMIGVSGSVYSQWNTGKTAPSKKSLAKVAAALNVEVEELLPDEETKKEPAADTSDKLPADFYLLSEEQQKQVTDYISFLLSQK